MEYLYLILFSEKYLKLKVEKTFMYNVKIVIYHYNNSRWSGA